MMTIRAMVTVSSMTAKLYKNSAKPKVSQNLRKYVNYNFDYAYILPTLVCKFFLSVISIMYPNPKESPTVMTELMETLKKDLGREVSKGHESCICMISGQSVRPINVSY